MTLLIQLLLFGVIFVANISDAFNIDCARRDFKHGSFVCVCNENNCGKFEKFVKTSPGKISMYFTNKNGERFDKTSNYFFMKNPMKNVDLPLKIKLDYNKTHQKIIGFGGAFTDSAGINFEKMRPKLKENLVKDYYGSEGLMYTMGRIPVGGTDFSVKGYSYDDTPNDESLNNFKLQEADTKYKIPFIHKAKTEAGNLKLVSSLWSPPAWMKDNDNLIHGGNIIGEPGEKYYKLFAEYYIKFIQEYQKQNVSLWGLTIVNEPILSNKQPNYRFNSLAMNSTIQRDFLKYDFGPLLKKSNLDHLQIMVYDGNIANIEEYVNTVLNDNDAAKLAHGIAFHWYDNKVVDRKVISKIGQKFPNHFLISTESCEMWKDERDHVQLGSWNPAERYAEDIINGLNDGIRGYLDWNLVLNKQGGPNYVHNFVDAAIIVEDNGQEYYKQPLYYALGHFSRFLTPESVRIDHSEESRDPANLLVTVFKRPDNATVVTALNKKDRQFLVEVHDPNHGYYYFNLGSHTIATLIWFN